MPLFKVFLSFLYTMWLKICYVFRDRRDKLLGYIHIPTNKENFNEEIKWVQARQNDRLEKSRCSTPVLTDNSLNCEDDLNIADSAVTPTSTVEENGEILLTRGSLADSVTIITGQQEAESNEVPRANENGFSVEIRYKPCEHEEIYPISSISNDDEENRKTPDKDGILDSVDGGLGKTSVNLADPFEVSLSSSSESSEEKIGFCHPRDGKSDSTHNFPLVQDEFNKGMRNISSTPKEKSSSKSPSSKSPPSKSPLFKAFTFQDQDTTYSAPSSSSVLKEMVYRQWLEKKKQQTKEEIKSKMVARKKAREEAEMESKERKISAKKTFDAWNESKTETILTEKELKQKAKLAEKEKLEESLQRKRDAEKYFESWKREKTEKQKKLNSQKKKEEREKEKETFLEKRKTTTEALKAFESWKAQKDMSLSEIKQKKEEEKKRQEEEKLLELERKQEAKRVFEEWKSKKSPRRSPSPCRLTQRSWCPAGRNLSSTIPPKVQPVVIRQRHVVSR